ncbi:MAG: 50S ribosomal protein L17 [Dysgonamonadaceae bacterium]|jgi:large subunit ribosomal protein L17|nr:50S ribosomal protein L17 [Dysgonamonadaceae bacterium]MDD3308548.1 50S ribosomal protein L17 [Dysgonamonadaceae bacterium]MDD3899949.1 50S ribosomal protein L17 [Dysgonamonadaceae bacterium]MDD4398692.1 50S ribosomal protein L17 [Dysgonamonadaceae bacterium]MEA5080553.1 50S ribosomal protein L17 [Dysgonamonadaceae bacterium]
MRHNRKNNHLGRKTAHRGAMLSNMATSLIMHKRIFTTVPKARELRKFVEPIITKSKEDSTHSRRVVFSMLQSKEAVTELFQNVSQKVADRPGGYTRIIKTGFRLGDNAATCFIELVDYNENMLAGGEAKKAKTRRSRKRATGASATTDAPESATKAKKEDVKDSKVVEETATTETKVASKSKAKKEKVVESETAKTEDATDKSEETKA